MKFKKIFSLTTASILAISLLGGCGSSKNADTSKSNEQVKLEVWLTPQWKGVMDASEEGADYDSFFKKAAEKFTAENPNITIDVQVIPGEQRSDKLSVAIQTKTLPDIFFESTFAMSQYAHMGVIEPIDDIIDENSKKDIQQSIWDNVKIEGKTYFYPFGHNPGTLVYNADMFKAAGLDKYIGEKNDIVTWSTSDYETILKALKENNPNVPPMSLFAKNNQGDTWNISYLRMFGNKFYNDKGNIVVNDDNGVKALEYIDNLRKEGLTTPGAETLSSNDCNAMFLNKQVAVSFTNSVLFNGLLADMENGKVEKFDARLANIPGDPDPLSFTYVTGACVFNTGDQARIDAAKKFVKFFSSDPELVKASKNTLPVRESVSEELKGELPYLEAYNKNSKYIYNFSNNTPGYAEIRNALFPELQAVFTGQKTPKDALDTFTNQANQIIETNRATSQILGK